jgi:DNA-binding MarR family transcriptional regulator
VDPAERDILAETLLDTSRALVAIAVRSMAAGVAEVTVVQHRVLVLLDDRGPLSVNAVAEELGVDQSNASRHCTRLERLGLVTRTRAAHDGRAVDVAISAAGRRQVRTVQEARRREIGQVVDRLPEVTVREVVRGLEAFRDAAAADVEDAGSGWLDRSTHPVG